MEVALDAATTTAITAWLDEVQGARKKYRLELDDVRRVLADAASSEHGIGLRHGGKGGRYARTPMTIALAVRRGEELVLAISTCPARKATPDAAWPQLAPWHPDFTYNAKRSQHWTATVPRSLAIPIRFAEQSLKQSRDAVLAEILANPDDDEPRLVYADMLSQVGDPRGEFINVQCAIAAGNDDPKLAKRETALRRKHGAAWTREAKQFARACTLRRGFVDALTISALEFGRAGRLFETEPIVEVELFGTPTNVLRELAAAPHLRRVQRLVLYVHVGHDLGLQSLCELWRSPSIATLRSLAMHVVFGPLIGPGIETQLVTVFDGVTWPAMERLVLRFEANKYGGFDHPPLAPDWIAERLWPSLARAQMPVLRSLAIAPFANVDVLAAAFPAAAIESWSQ